MDKETIIQNICKTGVIAVVRAESGEQACKIADACIKGGVCAIEITFTVPKAHKVIEKLADTYKNGEIIIGAGTVMDSETARIAILSGAQYIVSPYFDEGTVKLCNRYRVPVMPGAMTVKDAVAAMEAGADIIKIFPGDIAGPLIIKSFLGPIPYAKMIPTGNVDLTNIDKWIKAGAVAVGVGSALVGGAKNNDYDNITNKAKAFCEAVKKVRE